MSDVFISYASADRDIARRFALALASQGWSVWWDRKIEFGSAYARDIERELGHAACVLVLWSRRSIASDWVCNEAAVGLKRGVLLPITLEEGLVVPIAFSGLHLCAMQGWDGDVKAASFALLAHDVAAKIARHGSRSSGPVAGVKAVDPPAVRSSRSPKRLGAAALVVAPTVLLFLVAALASRRVQPTAVQLDLRVRAVSLASAQEQHALLTDRVHALELSLHGLSMLTLQGGSVHALAPAGAAESSADQWRSLALPAAGLTLRASAGNGASLSIEGAAARSLLAAAELDGLALPGLARMDIAVDPHAPAALRMRYDGLDWRWVVRMRSGALVQLSGAAALAGAADAAWLTRTALRVEADDSGSVQLDAQGLPGGTTVHFRPKDAAAVFRAEPTNLRLSAMALLELGPGGVQASSVTGQGSIAFSDFPSKTPIPVAPGDFVVLGPLTNFYLRRIQLLPETRMLRIEAGGLVSSIRSGPAGDVREQALSHLEAARLKPGGGIISIVLLWALATLAAIVLFIRHRRS